MGGDHHVGVLDDQVIHRAHRQVGLQRLPLGAVVERAVQAEFSTCVQQPSPIRVFTYDPDEVIFGQTSGDLLPGLAPVGGLVDVGRIVALFVASDRHVDGALGVLGLGQHGHL